MSLVVFNSDNGGGASRVVDVDQYTVNLPQTINLPLIGSAASTIAPVVSNGTFIDDAFNGTGPVNSQWLSHQNDGRVDSIGNRAGYYSGDVLTNPGDITEWFHGLSGTYHYQTVAFPASGFDEFVIRDVGIGPVGNPQGNHFSNGGFAFTGVMCHVDNGFSSLDYEFAVVGHRGAATATLECKSTLNGVSGVTDEGANVFTGTGVTHGDIRIRLMPDRTIEFAYSDLGANNWILINGGTGATTVNNKPTFGATVHIGMIIYAQGTTELPFTGSFSSFERASTQQVTAPALSSTATINDITLSQSLSAQSLTVPVTNSLAQIFPPVVSEVIPIQSLAIPVANSVVQIYSPVVSEVIPVQSLAIPVANSVAQIFVPVVSEVLPIQSLTMPAVNSVSQVFVLVLNEIVPGQTLVMPVVSVGAQVYTPVASLETPVQSLSMSLIASVSQINVFDISVVVLPQFVGIPAVVSVPQMFLPVVALSVTQSFSVSLISSSPVIHNILIIDPSVVSPERDSKIPEADLREMFSISELGDVAVISAISIVGIFKNEYIEAFDVVGSAPAFSCIAKDIEAITPAVARGTNVTVLGVLYSIKNIKNDGNGIVNLIFNEV